MNAFWIIIMAGTFFIPVNDVRDPVSDAPRYRVEYVKAYIMQTTDHSSKTFRYRDRLARWYYYKSSTKKMVLVNPTARNELEKAWINYKQRIRRHF